MTPLYAAERKANFHRFFLSFSVKQLWNPGRFCLLLILIRTTDETAKKVPRQNQPSNDTHSDNHTSNLSYRPTVGQLSDSGSNITGSPTTGDGWALPASCNSSANSSCGPRDGDFLIDYVTVPLAIVTSLVGNSLTIVVMRSPYFRKQSATIILIALAVSDATFSVLWPFNKQFVRTFLRVDIRSLSEPGCKIFFFLFRTSKMASSWFVVNISIERFIAVWFPLKAKLINTKRNTVISVAVVVGALSVLNGVWTIASKIKNKACIPHFPVNGQSEIPRYFLVAGICLYSIIPMFLLMVLNPMIIVTVYKHQKLRKAMATGRPKNNEKADDTKKLTVMLLSITVAFVILVTPISIAHLYTVFLNVNLFETTNASIIAYRDISQILELINYSVNFFLYALTSKPFRDHLLHYCIKKREKSSKSDSTVTQTSTVSVSCPS